MWCIVTLCVLVALSAGLPGCGESADTSPLAANPVGNSGSEAKPAVTDEQLLAKLDEVLDFTEQRYLDTRQHAAWQIVHGIMAFGQRFQVMHDGELVSALDYLLQGNPLTGWTLRPAEHGVLAVEEPGTKTGQGHHDQWLGYLSVCELKWDDPIVVGGQTYKIGDLVTQAQWECREGMECGWTLPGLSAFLPLDATWQANDGGEWNFERLVAMETAAELSSASCGGTHSLIGLSTVLNRYLASGRELSGAWADADEKIRESVRRAKAHQQPDGSFSSGYFDTASSTPDLKARINATGHTLEFVTLAATDEEFFNESDPWVKRAAHELCGMLEKTKDLDLECGALYHAARALQLYRIRLGDRLERESTAGADETPGREANVTENNTDAPPLPPDARS